jgi:CheY-like chemotaxis protein
MDARRSLGARILLVDDQPDQVEMYRLALEHAGFVVDEAADGEGALASARSAPPDAIVLDVRLPDIDGWKVCAALKRDPRTTRIPIVILTAIALPAIAERASQAGCAAHLLKPCYPDDLTRTLRQVLSAT